MPRQNERGRREQAASHKRPLGPACGAREEEHTVTTEATRGTAQVRWGGHRLSAFGAGCRGRAPDLLESAGIAGRHRELLHLSMKRERCNQS